ncbi:pyridoxamine 5'-phosphate oxidase family protein [Oceanicola sp. 502str15]|uniref:pyridoxamine 5'-phosphate oxidase family protein n=1 Tax=Oceanicola sp. 502str15 TaxID=2696061 RepID=UPI0020944A8D|nr:pyridoxamine 5'-phosphate oxidase family protein [Oceanicola sp. 502str15]MCO6381659.1 pyridoxamine 5'-phosphate oxidase family protein [Oceanicola sp. 502str15]
MDGFDAQDVIADEAALRALFPPVSPLAQVKSLPALDRHARDFIARSPFVCLGTQGGDGTADVSPRGDAPGFVEVLGDRLLAIPDRPGNNRLDSLSNILANPRVGLLFMVPGFDETLRVNGQARLVRAPELLERMAVNGREPRLAVVVAVEEVFLHCAKAFRRSKLWDPAARQDRSEMPSLSKMILEQTTGAPEDAGEMEKIDAGLEEAYRKSMY